MPILWIRIVRLTQKLGKLAINGWARVDRVYDQRIQPGMSIQMIAKELYRLQQAVEKLEEQLRCAPVEKETDLKDQLRQIKAERDRMRNILEGQKDPPTYSIGKVKQVK